MDPFFPNASCHLQAKELQARLAGAKLRLFKSSLGVPLADITLAMLEAAECDFDGYAEETIAAWLDPINSTGGGAEITAPTEQFDGAAPGVTVNSVGGYWIEFPAIVGPPAVAAEVCVVRMFDNPVMVGTLGSGVKITPTIVIPNGGDA